MHLPLPAGALTKLQEDVPLQQLCTSHGCALCIWSAICCMSLSSPAHCVAATILSTAQKHAPGMTIMDEAYLHAHAAESQHLLWLCCHSSPVAGSDHPGGHLIILLPREPMHPQHCVEQLEVMWRCLSGVVLVNHSVPGTFQ